MSGFDFLNPAGVFIEISAKSWWVAEGESQIEIPVERDDAGRLTDSTRVRLFSGLRAVVNKKGWQPRGRAWVAVGARGVSLRRLVLPPSPPEEWPRLLRLQIEAEFP